MRHARRGPTVVAAPYVPTTTREVGPSRGLMLSRDWRPPPPRKNCSGVGVADTQPASSWPVTGNAQSCSLRLPQLSPLQVLGAHAGTRPVLSFLRGLSPWSLVEGRGGCSVYYQS